MKNLRNLATLGLILILGCQDSVVIAEKEKDPDMEAALDEVQGYLAAQRSNAEFDVTVIRYREEELLYKTNTIKGAYEPIDEETVTAVTVINGYIFWFKAGGVKSLENIELDKASQELLDDCEPFELIDGLLWALYIPHDSSLTGKILKYDIVYEIQSGETIRLDPKIQIKHPNS